MRRLAVYFALLHWLQLESGASAFVSNKLIQSAIRSFLGTTHRNEKENKNNEVLNHLIKLCFIEISKEENASQAQRDTNFNITNKNTIENQLQLPTIKMPNITIVIVEEEDEEPTKNCTKNETTNCQKPKARTATQLQRTGKQDFERKLGESETVLIKRCIVNKLKILNMTKS